MTGNLGTACGKGVYTPLRLPIPASKTSSTTFLGHFSQHTPHPVHKSWSIKRARFRMVTVKFPIYPSTFSTSLQVNKVIFLWLPTSNILGVRMHAEQSRVGKVLSNCAMCPPMDGSRSTM